MDIGLDVETPQKTCDDQNCPFHGSLRVRGQMLEGKVVGDRMQNTVNVEREYLRYLSKFERYEKRKAQYLAHNPACIGARIGDGVRLMECRPISKAKSFVVVEKFALLSSQREIAKPEEKRKEAEKPKEKAAPKKPSTRAAEKRKEGGK